MPHQTISNEIGRQGERWFLAQLPDNWVLQRPTEDVGVDGNIVICEEGELNGFEFRVQVKSTENFHLQDDLIVLSGVNRSSFIYWLTGPIPTLIVAYESSSKNGYAYWVNKLPRQNADLLTTTSNTVTLKIPTAYKVERDLWVSIKKDLSDFYGTLDGALQFARRSNLILPFLHSINKLYRDYLTLHTAKPREEERTEEQRNLMLGWELLIHKNFLRIIREFREKAKFQEEGEDYLDRVYDGYIAAVSNVVVNFQDLLDGKTDEVEIRYHPQLAIENREMLMGIMVGVLTTFTKSEDEENDNFQYHGFSQDA